MELANVCFVGFEGEFVVTLGGRCALLFKTLDSVSHQQTNAIVFPAVRTTKASLVAYAFFRYLGYYELCVKQYKIQKSAFCPEEKELTKAEYIRLIAAAKKKGNERLNLIIQTICGSGIRVSELQYITVEAVKRGEAFVNCKGKNRRIFIVAELRKKLLSYIKTQNIKSGAVFVTKNGKPVSLTFPGKVMYFFDPETEKNLLY